MSVRTGVNEYNQPISDISSDYVGEFKYFGFETVPPHCLACDGSEVSRETYSELFEVFGETFGAGDGATTFNLPDLRGAFLRCVGGNAAALGAEQGDAIRNIYGSWSVRPWAVDGGSNASIGITADVHNLGQAYYSTVGASADPCIGNGGVNPGNMTIVNLDASRVVPTANENRPVNYAANVCVVYE